ncbi:MAG: ParA family protein [Planctomycetes bacterium]|nr:ParA family protein [Planctomycetota bacterium]
MFLTFVNAKGGVGKSTLAVHAAYWLQAQGLRVAVIDADAQASTSEWLTQAAPNLRTVKLRTAAQILETGPRLIEQADAVVADGPAALGAEIAALISLADLALMPIGPSMMDVHASYRTARLIYRTRFHPKRRGLPRAYTVLNRVQQRTRLARIANAAAPKYGFPVAETCISLRQSFAEACGRGTVVWNMGALGRSAAFELSRLFCEVLGAVCPPTQLLAEAFAPASIALPESALPANVADQPARLYSTPPHADTSATSRVLETFEYPLFTDLIQ